MNQTTNLNKERNELHQLHARFSRDSWIVIIFCATAIPCLIAANLAWQRAERAIDQANKANAAVLALTDINDDLRSTNETLHIRTAKLDAWLKAKGIDLKEIYDD